VLIHRLGKPQLIGVTPANALMSVGPTTWTANHAGGAGTITISTLTVSRATGAFDFVAVNCDGLGPFEQAVTEGTFDVRLVQATPTIRF
jgi:hypothetical protein